MIGECISYRARFQPDAPALETPQGPISFRRFEQDINRIAAAVAALGFTPGSTVLISDSRPYIHWLLLFALERLGHVSVSDDVADVTFGVVLPDAIIAESADKAGRTPIFLQTSSEWLGSVLGGPVVPEVPRLRRPDDAVRIVLSSGTTGLPKAVLMKRDALDRRVMHIQSTHLPLAARMLSTMGINAAGGYTASLATWMGGGTMIYAGALGTAQAVLQLKPTFMLMAPIQLQHMLAQWPADAPRAPALQIALGGSAAPRRLCAEAARRITDHLVFGYGSTEAGLTACGPAMLVNERPGAAGYRVPWAEMQIVGDDDLPLPAGEIGRVRVKSDEMVEASAGEGGSSAFSDGWFYPGDLGSIGTDGLFVIEGRIDDVLNIGGVKVSAWSVEERLMAFDNAVEAAALLLPGPDAVPKLVAAVVGNIDPSSLAADYAMRHAQAIEIVSVTVIPRNPMGKILRTDLRQALLSKER